MLRFHFYVFAFYFAWAAGVVFGENKSDETAHPPSSGSTSSDSHFWQSFALRPPFLDEPWAIRMWDFGGDTILDLDRHIRLTAAYDSRSGWIWSKKMLDRDEWEVVFEFKIQTHGAGMSADGMAFWYTPSKYTQGNAMGFKTTWEGLGILIDTYDNVNSGFISPRTSVILNDGTKEYDKDTNGKAIETAGCDEELKDREYPTLARIRYRKKDFLSLDFSTAKENEWKNCFRLHDVVLPDAGYLGFTALTGGLYEDHDLLHLSVQPLNGDPSQSVQEKVEPFDLPPDSTEPIATTSSDGHIWTWALVAFVAIVVALGYRYLPRMVQKDYQRF